MTARRRAAAKLNLTLDVVGKEGGYHLLDSLVTTIDVYDLIRVSSRKDKKIRLTMHGMGSELLDTVQNNAYRAALAFQNKFETAGADVTVYKNIPMRAGMGGSSADAAGVLRALAEVYSVSDMGALKELADGLGSDTGYLLTGGIARMRGRGERVEPLDVSLPLWFLLVCPEEGVETARCFSEYDEGKESFSPRTERAVDLLERGDTVGAARLFGNALTSAAKTIEPAVERTLASLKQLSPLCASMTGSGSGCFAAFETRELAEWAQSRFKGKGKTSVVRAVKQ